MIQYAPTYVCAIQICRMVSKENKGKSVFTSVNILPLMYVNTLIDWFHSSFRVNLYSFICIHTTYVRT